MAEPMTSVTLKHATVKSYGAKDGKTTVVIQAPTDECDLTSSEITDMTSGTFLGTVTIKGRVVQQTFELPEPTPKKPTE